MAECVWNILLCITVLLTVFCDQLPLPPELGQWRLHSHAPYEASFADPVRLELKRRQDEQASPPGHSRRASARAGEPSDTPRDNRPLFEKYQFFTPGIFMALVSLVVLMSILYVGLSALASLEVSYGAFSKEMGPAAQKKNM